MNATISRTFLKKALSIAIIMSLIAPTFTPTYASGTIDFNAKITSTGDETYASNVPNVSYYNTNVTFQFAELSGGGASEYSINLPVGFVYQSSNTTGNTCANFSTLNASDGNYHFSFNGAAGCFAKVEFTYQVTNSTTPGDAGITLLERSGSNWTIVNGILLGISPTNTIIRAKTADLNHNGYVDAYILSFSTLTGVNAGTLSGITIDRSTVGTPTASGSNWILPFTDNFFNTGNLPQIGGTFDGATLGNATIQEED